MDYGADLLFLSDTWMQTDKDDITAMLQTYGYKLLHNRRRNRDKVLGGGIGVILKLSLVSKQISCKPFSSFEHTIVKVQLLNQKYLTLISVYRLQFVPTNTFLDEFTELLEILCTGNDIFIITGDVNIHLDTDESNAQRLRDIFLMFNLEQYVNFPTHKLSHTLDIVLTRVDQLVIYTQIMLSLVIISYWNL